MNFLEPWETPFVQIDNTEDEREFHSINSVSSFCLMVNTVLRGNKRFTLDEVIDDWWNKYIQTKRFKHWKEYHEIVYLKINIYRASCQKFKCIAPKSFIKIYKKIDVETFGNYSLKSIESLDSILFKIIGHQTLIQFKK